MIPKIQEKEKAILLRKEGFSYTEILEQVPVAKSSLSLWLQSVGLSKKQKQRLTEKKWEALQRGLEAIRVNKVRRHSAIKKEARREVKEYIKDPFWVLGTALYWAEGSKVKSWGSPRIAFSNMDPST